MGTMRLPGLNEASTAVRQCVQHLEGTDQQLRTDVDAAAAVAATGAALAPRVAALEAGGSGRVIRTVIQLTAAQVAALGAVTGPADVELSPNLPAFSSLLNVTAHVVTPFVSSVAGYDLDADLRWRANDAVPPDATPLDMAVVKSTYRIGSDSTTVNTWEGFGTAATGSPFDAENTANRWPYTPTLVASLQENGGGGATLDTYTDGLLEIIVLSVTME